MSTLGKYSSFVCYDLSGILRLIEMDCVSEYAYILHDKDKRLNAPGGLGLRTSKMNSNE